MAWHHTQIDKKRVKVIGRSVMALPPGKKIAVAVDKGAEYEGKCDWYLKQLQEKFPALNATYAGALTPQIDIIHVHSPACSQN